MCSENRGASVACLLSSTSRSIRNFPSGLNKFDESLEVYHELVVKSVVSEFPEGKRAIVATLTVALGPGV